MSIGQINSAYSLPSVYPNGKVRAAAAKSGRLGTIVLAIYGPVLAVIEIDCASYCCGKDSYDGGNTFNTKRAIKFYLDKIKSFICDLF